MRLSSNLSSLKGVKQAAVMMGTKLNKEFLKDANLISDEVLQASPSDVCICIEVEDNSFVKSVSETIDDFFNNMHSQKDVIRRPRSISKAMDNMPDANLAVISVPGIYAAEEAKKALRAGLNVFLFSDNVSLDDELMLKQEAEKNDLICMGPDCGTGIINGVALGFANKVHRGNIGIVGASGTGIQEITVLIHGLGEGISHAIGTGGRDLKKPVNAISALTALKSLKDDEKTKVIVFVSKPPDKEIEEKVLMELSKCGKPVIVLFLGSNPPNELPQNIHWAKNMEDVAKCAVALLKDEEIPPYSIEDGINKIEKSRIKDEIEKLDKNQTFLRGLYSGGTLCDEAIFILAEMFSEIWSGHNVGSGVKELENPFASVGHSLIDMGEDIFTRGKPHPMIDYGTRISRMLDEAEDEEVAVILLDVVIGYGSHPNPKEILIPTIKKIRESGKQSNRYVSIVASVCGTDIDPQNLEEQTKALEQEGVLVFSSNAKAAYAAGLIANKAL